MYIFSTLVGVVGRFLERSTCVVIVGIETIIKFVVEIVKGFMVGFFVLVL